MAGNRPHLQTSYFVRSDTLRRPDRKRDCDQAGVRGKSR
ncbi:hypothetical protein MSL71_47790 [Desulfoluna butyratoxydans]|uniref:Uncharacterized protein n=1 Tax=Desulfoluna butyratoxydans TaxID=231438 RepID=A0A4U8YZC7_9BACT|nr:hypothetical protein MSL71_47790 [Desulfoluna butyratoxydans]